MKIQALSLREVLLLTPRVHRDDRGLFLEAWNARDFASEGIDVVWAQDNLSDSVRGVLRGMHCQVRQQQGKLVRCVAGVVFDAVVDVRVQSPTFGQWCGARLDAESHEAMWIPPGFAHGYYVLSERATVHYKATDFYAPEHERCLRWDDPEVGVVWPLLAGTRPTVSEKDAHGASLSQARGWLR